MIFFQHHFGTVTIRQRVSMMVVNGKQQKSISLQSVPECFSHVLQPSQHSLQAKGIHHYLDESQLYFNFISIYLMLKAWNSIIIFKNYFFQFFILPNTNNEKLF